MNGGGGVGDDARSRLPGEGQRPVMPPREHRVPPRWLAGGGGALVVIGVAGLSIMTAASVVLPATFVVLAALIPIGAGIALRGVVLARRVDDRSRDARSSSPRA